MENSSKDGNTRPPDLILKNLYAGQKQQLELDMDQQTSSKSEKEYFKAVYCHPDYLTYMQSTSWETLGWKKHKLELLGDAGIAGRNIINLRYADDHLYGRKSRGTK